MTWTYDGAPSTSTAAGRRDAVRLKIGDTDTNDQQLTDEEIAFALSERGDNIYKAAASCARFLAGKFARLVDTKFDLVSANYSDLRDKFAQLARDLEVEAKTSGGGGLGTPLIGGIRKSEIESVREDDDRLEPRFRRGMFRNPPDEPLDDAEWIS